MTVLSLIVTVSGLSVGPEFAVAPVYEQGQAEQP